MIHSLKTINLMIGIIVELFFSWLILRFTLKKDLSVLGFHSTKSRQLHFWFGFLMAAAIYIIYQLMSTLFANNYWVIRKPITGFQVLAGIWWTIKSVLFEELLFRGALLYLVMEKWGVKKACFLSAFCFGIYHWFSFSAFGNPLQMAIIFFMTAIFGFMLAYSFAQTRSLYLPIGLHLGWNLMDIVLFSGGPLQQNIFVKANSNHLEGILSLFVFLFQIFALPVLVYYYLRFAKGKHHSSRGLKP